MHIVEAIAVQLGLDAKSYNTEADKAIRTGDKLEEKLGDVEKQGASLNEQFVGLSKSIAGATKILGGLFSTIVVSAGLSKLISDVQKVNNELFFLEKNLSMSARTIKAWQGAATAGGGSAEGMTSSMKGLNKSMNDFVVRGDTTLLPFMNALGVSMVDNKGKLKDTDAMMLDLADSFSKMDREQAFSIGQDMGFDEGTLNVLIQGRDALKESLEYQKQMYVSSERELEASRELSKNTAQLQAHWESMKLMMGNAIIPLLVKLTAVAKIFFEFLQRHQETVQNVFEAMGIIIGAVLIPILGKALIAMLAFIAPFAPFILVVTALSTAFVALYDDYKTWAEGGNSLFNWGAFRDYIDNAKLSTDNLKNAFKNLSAEVLSGAIPTLKGYADIVRMLYNGDFKGAGSLATEMLGNLGTNIGNFIDDATGNQQGSFISKTGDFLFGGGNNNQPNATTKFNSKAFTSEKAKSIARVAKNIGVNPNDLAAVISFETGGSFSPSAKNPNSSATGLIQFMKGSGGTKGQYYGMSRDKFASLSFDEQMNYVERYFKERDKRFRAGNEGKNSVGDVYGAVTGYGYKRGSDAYNLNKVWDSNKNGVIEKGEMVQNPSFKKHQRGYFDLSSKAQQAQAQMSQGNVSLSGMQSSSRTNNVDVKVGDIKVYTTASTISGTSADAMSSVSSQVNQLVGSMT